MAQIARFQGIHYDPEVVNIADVIGPPYDVISPAEQTDLYDRDPSNIVRLILPREEAGDTSNERYQRAATFLSEALSAGALVKDIVPALYEYIQQFQHPLDPDQIVTRTTLLVALKLEPYENGVVLPHEETHPKAKADRLEMMRATKANPEPIYGLYEDPSLVVTHRLKTARGETEPLLDTVAPGTHERHTVYRHDDADLIDGLESVFADLRVWIADGHHRYETALNYRNERRAAEGDPATEQAYDSLLIGLSAFEDPGLVVLPTHRLVRGIPAERMEQLPLLLERYFHIGTLSIGEARTWIRTNVEGEKRFAVVLPDRAYALTLRDLDVAIAAMQGDHCDAWKRLDVTILQALVLDRTLGISWSELAHTPNVAYTRDVGEAVDRVASGEFQLSCLLQCPSVEEVRDVAAAGDKMPQKSTFFYPKLWSGLMLRALTPDPSPPKGAASSAPTRSSPGSGEPVRESSS